MIQEDLYKAIAKLINKARDSIKNTVNLSMVYTYYEIGKRIFLEEQNGNKRADYGR